jgi:hypothetical protein
MVPPPREPHITFVYVLNMTDSVAGTNSSNTSTIQTTITARGGGCGTNTGGRSNIRGQSNQQANRGSRPSTNLPKGNFKGSTLDMNGHVLECYKERGDHTQFPKTLEALGEYAAKHLKFPKDLKSMSEVEPMIVNFCTKLA